MRSLRARLVAGLLALAAVGLIVLAAVTYAEQRSFLLHRVDQQVASAPPQLGRELGGRGIGPRGDADHDGDHRSRPGGDGPGPAGDAPPIGLPPGTYGQRRDASGRVLGSVVISYEQDRTANPDVPRDPPLDRTITVSGKGNDHSSYRLRAARDPHSGTVTIAAVPLGEVHQTLDRLL